MIKSCYDVLDSGVRIRGVFLNTPIDDSVFVERIRHFVKYSAIRDLRHLDPELGMHVDLQSANRTSLRSSSGYYEVADGTEVALAITNGAQSPVDIVVFSLAPR